MGKDPRPETNNEKIDPDEHKPGRHRVRKTQDELFIKWKQPTIRHLLKEVSTPRERGWVGGWVSEIGWILGFWSYPPPPRAGLGWDVFFKDFKGFSRVSRVFGLGSGPTPRSGIRGVGRRAGP